MTPAEQTKKTYDTIAADYSKANFKPIWVEEFKTYASLVPGKKILDIGSGAGRDAVIFTEAGFDYTGIDASQAMLDVAKERAPKGTYKQMDFYNLDFPGDTFDGFWAAASFLHVPKSEVVPCILEARRILKKGGIGFISVKQKEKDGMNEGLITQERFGGTISRYFAFYDPEEFNKYITDSDLEVIDEAMYHEDDERHTVWLGYFVKKN